MPRADITLSGPYGPLIVISSLGISVGDDIAT